MATDFFIKRGDRLPALRVTLRDSLGGLPNLTGATVKFIMNDKAAGTKIVQDQAAAIIGNPLNGVVEYAWQAGDTDIASTYSAEFEVTYLDGKDETFPNSKYIVIKIVPDLEADGS